MIYTAGKANLVGLAGNQVGRLNRIFVIDMNAAMTEEENPQGLAQFTAFVNPVMKINSYNYKTNDIEGCGSIPNVWGFVERYRDITITAQDARGKHFETFLTGMLARIAQHELDHLNGVLFTSKAKHIKVIEPEKDSS